MLKNIYGLFVTALIVAATLYTSPAGAQTNRWVRSAGAVLKATYVYNGAGQRVKKIEATGAQRTLVYHYGPGGELLGETIYNSGGAKIGERDYLWLDTLPLAQSERTFSGGSVTSSQFVYLHADQLNTPRLATNGSGSVVWRWDSDAFGIGAANEDPDADTSLVNVRLRFAGQYHDEEIGLNHNYFRDYDSGTGRYVESDPIGLAGGINSYRYGYANPLTYFDPLGLLPCTEVFCIPSFADVKRTSSTLVADSGWRLANIHIEPPQLRLHLPLRNFAPRGRLVAPTQIADCFFGRTQSFRDTYTKTRKWSCMSVCYECGRYELRTTAHVDTETYESLRVEGDTRRVRVSAIIPLFACMEKLNELR